jgi:hypothetical protein
LIYFSTNKYEIKHNSREWYIGREKRRNIFNNYNCPVALYLSLVEKVLAVVEIVEENEYM